MNRIQYSNWIPGGVLRVYNNRHGVWHFGIAGRTYGMVMHASKDRGQFVETTFEEFAEGQPDSYTWLPEGFEQQEAALIRAESQIGKLFNLFRSNCEDYVNWIVTGVARSPQREQHVAIAGLGVLAVLLIGALGAKRAR
ncbi:MAG: hypothetical protein WBD23_06680 [Candidatus Acidiferrales bacterium]